MADNCFIKTLYCMFLIIHKNGETHNFQRAQSATQYNA